MSWTRYCRQKNGRHVLFLDYLDKSIRGISTSSTEEKKCFLAWVAFIFTYLHLPTFMPFFLGPFGGVRATVALRPFLSELGMVILPSTVSIPTIQNSGITEEGTTKENERYLNLS